MENSIDRQIDQAIQGLSGWATIDDLLATVRDRVIVPADEQRHIQDDWLKSKIRRRLKSRHGPDGLSEWESIERTTPEGEKVRAYRQLAIFSKDDFKLSAAYHGATGVYHLRKANSLTNRCNEDKGTEMQLPFPEFGLLRDDEAEAS